MMNSCKSLGNTTSRLGPPCYLAWSITVDSRSQTSVTLLLCFWNKMAICWSWLMSKLQTVMTNIIVLLGTMDWSQWRMTLPESMECLLSQGPLETCSRSRTSSPRVRPITTRSSPMMTSLFSHLTVFISSTPKKKFLKWFMSTGNKACPSTKYLKR